MLAGCGGGGDSAPTDRQAGNIAVGEPNGGRLDTTKFVALAQQEACADSHNRLFVIDQQYVFWDRAGRCADNAYSFRLYGATPEQQLCSSGDSIAGPRTSCVDDKHRKLFDTLVQNAGRPDLGLGSDHKIEKIGVLTPVVPFDDIGRSSHSGVDTAKDVVVRDAASWIALWSAHAGAKEPEPKIDFNTSMVVAVFMGTRPNGCYNVGVTGIERKDGKLVVTKAETTPESLGSAMCTQAITTPAHLVQLDRSDEAVVFVATGR
jgi:hypothetical protein